MAWTDEKRELAVEKYEAQNPTPETSMEIVKEVAEELGESPNGVRMILSKAGVYVKSDAAAKEPSSKKPASTRVSKADSIQELKELMREKGVEPDDELLDKLTGKLAVYLTNVIKNVTSE